MYKYEVVNGKRGYCSMEGILFKDNKKHLSGCKEENCYYEAWIRLTYIVS
jgi:hypothetical protein